MQGKEKLIDDILSSAKSTAAAMVEEATREVDAEVAALRSSLDEKQKIEREEILGAAQSVYSGQVKLAELESNKVLLQARQDCVNAVYDGVKQKILSAPDAEYLKLLEKLIVSVCEDGDEIVAAKSDAKRVTAAWVKKVATAAKKKLTLSKEAGEFSGGVILRNARYDRDLSVDEIVAELKEATIAETVQKLGL
ncbi:MAG: hypothetical protein HDT28_09295 [Clostridiales bacterium]|nr:hypothetical protein [Clostridiales bacterium]